MSRTLFLSFHKQDLATAKRIALALREADFAITTVSAKTTDPAALKQELADKISRADALIALISPDSAASRRFRAEANYATKRDKPVIPVLIAGDDIPPELADNCYDLTELGDDQLANFVASVGDRLSHSGDEAEDQALFAAPDAELRDDSRLRNEMPKRKRQGSLLVSPSGGPSNLVLISVAVVLAAVVALVALKSRIGQSGESNSASIANASANIPDGWRYYETDRIGIGAPPDWADLSEDDSFGELSQMMTLSGLGAEASDLEAAIEILLSQPDAGDSFFVMTAPMPEGEDLSSLAEEFRNQVQELGVGSITTDTIQLPVGESLRVAMRLEFMPGASMGIFMYMTPHDGTLYMAMAWTTTPDAEAIIDAMIQTYRIK